jgi:1,4-dihydroxy-2-naphthoyl-CoA hydrolase
MEEPRELLAMMPFAARLGIELCGATAEEVSGRLAWREELCTATISSTTNFLRGVRSGHANGTARPLRVGRSVIVVETEVRDDDGKLLAHTTQSQAVLR